MSRFVALMAAGLISGYVVLDLLWRLLRALFSDRTMADALSSYLTLGNLMAAVVVALCALAYYDGGRRLRLQVATLAIERVRKAPAGYLDSISTVELDLPSSAVAQRSDADLRPGTVLSVPEGCRGVVVGAGGAHLFDTGEHRIDEESFPEMWRHEIAGDQALELWAVTTQPIEVPWGTTEPIVVPNTHGDLVFRGHGAITLEVGDGAEMGRWLKGRLDSRLGPADLEHEVRRAVLDALRDGLRSLDASELQSTVATGTELDADLTRRLESDVTGSLQDRLSPLVPAVVAFSIEQTSIAAAEVQGGLA